MLASLNASLEPYNGSRSQKSHNNFRRMLSVVYFEGFFNRFKAGEGLRSTALEHPFVQTQWKI